MRQSLQAFMKRIKSKTVFIIGGGNSARNVDFDLLQDEETVCINDAFDDFPNAAGIYWVDETWASENYDKLNLHKCPHKFTSKIAQHVNFGAKEPKSLCNAAILKRTGDFGYDPNPDCVMGNNSGVQVLNFVINMKPSKIILIGYDMKRDKVTNKTHYHNKSRLYIHDHIYSRQFAPSLEALSKGFSKHGPKVEIINANPNSAARCFRFGDYRDYLGENK